MHSPHTWHPCLSPGGKHTSYWAPEMGDHDELPLEILLFFLSVFLALDLSPSAASTAAATMSLLQFSLEAGVRRQELGVAGREGRVRWREAVWWALYLPQGTEGTPHSISAQLGHSYLLLDWREGIWSSSSPPSYVLACLRTHIFSLAPHRCHLLCMWQRCECFFGGKEELAIKKVALSQTTCLIYVMTDRHLIWFYLLGPFSPWRIVWF